LLFLSKNFLEQADNRNVVYIAVELIKVKLAMSKINNAKMIFIVIA
jgi:hypothetical protein